FQDGYTGLDDYHYDQAGNLITDKNKKITSVTYTIFNKPEYVTFENGSTIRYIYTANGQKIREIVQDTELSTEITRHYVSDMVYIDTSFQYLLTTNGRLIYDNPSEKHKYEYFVK